MDRQQFSQILNTRRKALGCTYLELTMKTGRDSSILQNILMGKTNVFMETVLQTIPPLKLEITVNKNCDTLVIDSTESLTAWAKKSMTEAGYSLNKFKDLLGITRVALTANYNGTSKMRIDTFLKWAEITGYTVSIQPK